MRFAKIETISLKPMLRHSFYDARMMTLLGLGYYRLAGVVFALLGVAGHVCRAVVNVYPDRLSDKPWLDMAISDGYDLNDRILGTEYDEAGFYRLDSGRNLFIAVLLTLAPGWGAMLFSTEVAVLFAQGADYILAWLGDLFMRRLAEIRWF
jgi:hypothetical protein